MVGRKIIQGGMGVGVSDWRLARAVSQLGQMGVVSGTGLGVVLARRLQQGDPDGHLRRALAHFPIPGVAARVRERFFVPGGKADDQPFNLAPMPNLQSDGLAAEMIVVANFVEVYLAKEGHDGVVGANYLEKVQIPTLPSLFGAMLAGVDYVLMGAGIPRFIPGILDRLALGLPVELKTDVHDAQAGETYLSQFDPAKFCGPTLPAPTLRRPKFLAIISSATLAMTLARKSNGKVDGFIVEGATAGGHNAPPRGPQELNDRGEPQYHLRDEANLEKIRALDLPFWLAGGCASPEKLAEALAAGASGIQVGTAFAFCDESSIEAKIKQQVRELARAGHADVFTDPLASPTGFPFKVVRLAESMSEPEFYERRTRICDVGYLRQAYRRPDGKVGYRCAAEPEEQYLKKGGQRADTVGRKCICNALFATIGLAQTKATPEGLQTERCLITAGNDVTDLARLFPAGQSSYTAADVVTYLLS